MEAKLQQYQAIKRELKYIKEKVEELEEKKSSIKGMVISDMNVQSSYSGNAIEDLLVAIEESLEEYIKLETKLLNTKLEIDRAIEMLEPIEREVLRYRYFEGMRFEEISCKIKYSYRTVRRIHKRSIEKLNLNII